MKINLKTYEYKKIELSNTEFNIPDEISYYFQTFIRRSIRVIPIWTTWNKEQYGKEEEIFSYHFTCVYQSFENKIESFEISVSNIESLYNSDKSNGNSDLIKSLLNNDLNVRTKDQFEADLYNAIEELNKYSTVDIFSKSPKMDINGMEMDFLEWCNTPIFRSSGELGFRLRVQPQFPEYNTYIVIDETGNSIFPKDKFLTTKELYEYYLNQI